ncbi:MAG: CDGSH iron-sulfur domain-containing protein [Deltaproteobacteria bacterium]|nr:CDGSH iron-sulfur domain-containing protein [Deltaproteobacteria bacterium]
MDTPKTAQTFPATVELEPGKHAWCACGLSQQQPFCDGTHKSTDFHPVKFIITEKKQVVLCQCKQTKNPPYCDGTHSSL